MKLIRKLGTRLSKSGRLESWGEFLCPNTECNKLVERSLSNGLKAKSCGCNQHNENRTNYKHGGKGTRLYKIWNNMKQRILNPNTERYKDYGGRGITICNDWLEFTLFRDWSLSNGYADNLTIDRKENEGNYEPSNCRFITIEEQQKNKRSNVIKNMEMANEIRALYKTGDYTRKELAEMYNVSQETITLIINNKRWRH